MQVKPVYVDPILEALKQHVTQEHLIISIVAGVKLAALESSLPEGSRVVHLLKPLFSINPMVNDPAQPRFNCAFSAGAGDAKHAMLDRPVCVGICDWQQCQRGGLCEDVCSHVGGRCV